MKLKWLFVFFVLVLSGSLVYTALAGHASRSRRSGSVITTDDSEIIVPDHHGGHSESFGKLIGRFESLYGTSYTTTNLKVKVHVNEQIRPLPGQSKINGIIFCQASGFGFRRFSYHHHVFPHPAASGTFTAASTVSSGSIVGGHFTAEVKSEPNLNALKSFCGAGYQPLSFVPVAFESVVTETVIITDQHNKVKFMYVQARAVDQCSLPNPATLQYQEQRPYHCVVIHEDEIG